MATLSEGRGADGGHAARDRDSRFPGIPEREAVQVSLAPESAHAGLEVVTVDTGADQGSIVLDGSTSQTTIRRLGPERSELTTGGAVIRVLDLASSTQPRDAGIVRREVLVDGWRVVVDLEPAARAALRARARRSPAAGTANGPAEVRAMIPGVVVAVPVTVGDRVSAGQKLVIVEAMKMQNELLAPRDGVIDRVNVVTGARIEVGDVLLVIS